MSIRLDLQSVRPVDTTSLSEVRKTLSAPSHDEDCFEQVPQSKNSKAVATLITKHLDPLQAELKKLWFWQGKQKKELTSKIASAQEQIKEVSDLDHVVSGQDLTNLSERFNSPTEFTQQLKTISQRPTSTASSEAVIAGIVQTAVKEVAATKIQAAFRGRQVRRETVKPKELYSKLSEALTQAGTQRSTLATELSYVLAREILDSKDPKFSGDGKRLVASSGELYRFYNFQKQKTVSIHSPADIWINRKGNRVEIEIIGTEIASGTFKTAYRSSILTVNLADTHHEQKTQPGVVSKFNKHKLDETRFNELVRSGPALIQSKFTAEEIRQYKLAGILEKLDRKTPQGIREARDVRYAGDLLDMMQAGLDSKQKTNIMSDLAIGARALHRRGIVHGDIKSENTLISLDKNEGYLADPDGVVLLGNKPKIATPGLEDAISIAGISTPFTDIFALAITAEVIFGKGKTPYQAEVKAVKEANLKTIAYLRQHPKIVSSLQSSDETQRQQGMQQLHQAFPEFQRLLNKIATTRA